MANIVRMVIQIRRATTEEWIAYKDVVPAAGEPCFDLTANTLKIGDGVTTYENLEPIGGTKFEVAGDGKSIVLEDDVFKLMGFDAAEVGATPRKKADGSLEWVVPSTETVEGLQTTVAGLQSDVTNLQTNVTTLQEIVTPSGTDAVPLLSRVETLEDKMDGTGEGSVDKKIDAKINEFAAKVTDDGTVNTIQEFITYVSEHGAEVAAMTADIVALQELVGSTSVTDQIAAAGHMSKAEAEQTLLSKVEAAATLRNVDYEIAYKPDGTLVDYREKEIRVMCPANTAWTLQNSGEGSDASMYYIGFKAYAPAGAVSFKEDLAEKIADETVYSFEGNDFAGVDAYGRKYSIVWLPVAQYNDVTSTWTYYGASSGTSKYIGWYYSVEWYNAAGAIIGADTIRINLSNEACHNAIEPYYMANVVKEVSMNGTLLDVVNGRVDITVNNLVKSSEEIVVNEDGSLGIGKISFSKIVQEEGETIILDGNA